jgi:uncharacterized protein (DUF3820 family)
MADLKDDSLMPYGKHKGEKMIDIPADYLLYLYDTGALSNEVSKYVNDNLDVLKQQAKQR